MTALRGARWTGRLAQASRLPEARPGAEPFPSGRGETVVERWRRARFARRAPRLAGVEDGAPPALRPPHFPRQRRRGAAPNLGAKSARENALAQPQPRNERTNGSEDERQFAPWQTPGE